MESSGIALCLFGLSLLCAVLYLVIAFAVKKKYTAHVARLQRILHTAFSKTNLPIGILATSLNAYAVIHYGEMETGLLLCGIFFVLSFGMERLIDKLIPEDGIYAADPVPMTQNTLFTALELLNEIAAQKSILLASINNYNGALLTGIKTTQDNVDAAALLIKKYIQDEKQRNETLAGKIKICNAVFEKLGGSAELAHNKMKLLNVKISSSCTALVSVENQEALLIDINLTFAKIFTEQSVELNKKIQAILDGLNSTAYKCAGIQNFPRPYKEIVNLYSVKIESILKILNRKKDNLLWQESFQTGKACVFTEPEWAITELSEAIRIKPECADAYFYRGMAYQYKDKPDYKAALQDYEKTMELNPISGVYANYIKKLKLQIGDEA